MSKQAIYQVDAFTAEVFGGNPAAVCPLEKWLPDMQMQAIAAENNLSETAFIIPTEKEDYHIRWFTPNQEVALCGHATLATAFIIFKHLGFTGNTILFHSQSGILSVKKSGELLHMDFPALPYAPIDITPEILAALQCQPEAIFASTYDLLCIYSNEDIVRRAQPNLSTMAQLPYRGVIFSAPGHQSDIYSRCFYPACDVPEDPVTGSAHCVLAPYWSSRLTKPSLHAIQGLKRQGELWCEIKNDRVILSGHCALYMQGILSL